MKNLILFLYFLPFACLGEGPETPTVSLNGILKNTLTKNGQIQESLQELEAAKAQVEQARAALFPRISAIFIAAPIFEERGNALSSRSNWNNWGPYLQGGFQVIQPLYTFNQIGSYRKAAEHQVMAKEELSKAKANEVVLSAKEYYYGYLMASNLEMLVEDLVTFLDDAAKTAEASLQKDKGNVKQHDVYKLKTTLDDLRQKLLLAKQSKKTAERAVNWISNSEYSSLEKKKITPEPYQIKTLEEYLKIARLKRPELKALEAGIVARDSLKEAKEAQSYPVLFVGGFGFAAWSPVRDRQITAFANDPFNNLQGGAGIGLKFDLELMRHSAEAQEQQAEAMKLRATQSYAAPGIELQVKKAFWELEQAIDSLEIADRRKDMAKKWFVSSAMGWSVGITPAKELMEALEGNGLAKKNHVETIYSLNMALARLSLAVGEEVTQLKY